MALLTSLAVFTLLAAACSIIFNKIKLPPLIGYIVAGIIVANVWTITTESQEIVDILSDIGLVMLMFCIGLEINLRKIRKQGIFAIGIVIIQLPIMMVAWPGCCWDSTWSSASASVRSYPDRARPSSSRSSNRRRNWTTTTRRPWSWCSSWRISARSSSCR